MAAKARRLTVRRLATVLLSTILAVAALTLLAEVAYRLLSPPSYVYDPKLVPDAELGWNSVPPITALPMNRDGAPAVMYLGDSFTQVAQWPVEAQQKLAGDHIITSGFNIGVSGYGTTQELMKLRRHINNVKPAAIVLLFFAWNDLRDNFPYPEIYYGPQRTSRPYLVRDGSSWSITPVRWASTIENGLLHSEAYLRLFNRAGLAINARVVERWPDLPARLGWRARLYYEQPVSWQPFYRERDAHAAYVDGAYDTTMEAFRQIHAAADPFRARLLVIGIDNSFTVDLDDQEDFLKPNPELNPSLPMRRMSELLGKEGIAFIDAQPELVALRQSIGHDVYNGPRGGLAGHLGPEGDRLVGDIAARWLSRELAR